MKVLHTKELKTFRRCSVLFCMASPVINYCAVCVHDLKFFTYNLSPLKSIGDRKLDLQTTCYSTKRQFIFLKTVGFLLYIFLCGRIIVNKLNGYSYWLF